MLHIAPTDYFASRHIGPNDRETAAMLHTIGAESLDALIAQTVPAAIRTADELALPAALSEYEYLKEAQQIADKNRVMRNYIGQGYYDTITPPVILRNVFENPGWYTQYTPYQAEIAQGRLESLLNFQTMVSDLTGLPVANASLLDEGTAAAEAMTLFFNQKNKGRVTANRILVSDAVFAQTIDILYARAAPLNIAVEVLSEALLIEAIESADFQADNSVFAVLVQYPNSEGAVKDFHAFADKVHGLGAYLIVAADIMSLALLTPPGDFGADCAVGNTQRFGVPMGFGGPHAAYFAIKDEFKRVIPGRIIGVSIDSHGNPALRMALQTREQHIRREKATSNICTAQALLSNMAAMYAVYHGANGIRQIATKIHHFTVLLNHFLAENGFPTAHSHYFDTLTIRTKRDVTIAKTAAKNGINFHYGNDKIQISLDETVNLQDLVDILACFDIKTTVDELANAATNAALNLSSPLTAAMQRTSTYLTHPVFNKYHSESLMMRYIKSLENKDLSLVHSMISLGSCTMKLNAAAEMMPVSMAGFSKMHPFQPAEQTRGYQQVFDELSAYLCEITGFTACSLQPNSGAQGEYAGLLAIRNYHAARGDAHRNIALIPSSAHGTNPASAVMAGMQVVVTKCDERGNIDVADLLEKAMLHKDNLAALMVTYPSTHGVFETAIQEICTAMHDNGGLVYMDGANMNAQVGLTSPGRIGADVCHLNLHKTFAIPHGGGGPGMGPICVNDKLKPFLPGHAVIDNGGTSNAVSAAPYGSASILLISYGYIRMLGAKGVTDSTKYAILNANYLKTRLENDYTVLYTGEYGRAAHEMILDLRMFKPLGIEAEDIAKRLMDYGFHAPTLSFPVAGTIMIEPTESEDKAELDRFCDALLAIRKEIDEVATGEADKTQNVLKNAPHTCAFVLSDDWSMPYSREKAAYPLPYLRENKFWATIGRVNNVHGDRNVICTCPSVFSYEL